MREQRKTEVAERAATIAAIKEGLADVKAGRTRPARAALRALAKKHGIRWLKL